MIRIPSKPVSSHGVAVIIGVGPKLGRSIAQKFAHEGYSVAILARDLDKLSRMADEIAGEEKSQVFAIQIDCSDSKSIREAFEGVLSLGPIQVLVYNASYQSESGGTSTSTTSFLNLNLDYIEKSFAVSALGASRCVQQVLTGMVNRGKGTILFTGCSTSLTGVAGLSDINCGKFALRGLSQSLAKELHPLGIHVAHVIINGTIRSPRTCAYPGGHVTVVTPHQAASSSSSSSSSSSVHLERHQPSDNSDGYMNPDEVAKTYWQLHVQNPSAWTQEIELCPALQIL